MSGAQTHLVERTGQPGVIPCGRLGVVIDKVHPGRARQPHFPSARQRSELADGLGLDGQVASARADDTQQLLSSRVDPGRRPRGVIDEIRSSLGGESLFPTLGQWTRACLGDGRASGGDDIVPSRSDTARRGRLSLVVGIRGVGTGTTTRVEHVVGQTPQIVPRSGISGRIGGVGIVGDLVRARSVPRRGPGVVVDIVLSPEMIDPPLPALGKRPQVVHMRIKVAVPGRGPGTAGVDPGGSRLSRRVGRGCTERARRVLIDGGNTRGRVGHLSCSFLTRCRGGQSRVGGRRRHLRRRVSPGSVGSGRTGRSRTHGVTTARGRSGVLNRSRRVGGDVEDQLAVDGQVFARLFQVPREHLYGWSGVVISEVDAR